MALGHPLSDERNKKKIPICMELYCLTFLSVLNSFVPRRPPAAGRKCWRSPCEAQPNCLLLIKTMGATKFNRGQGSRQRGDIERFIQSDLKTRDKWSQDKNSCNSCFFSRLFGTYIRNKDKRKNDNADAQVFLSVLYADHLLLKCMQMQCWILDSDWSAWSLCIAWLNLTCCIEQDPTTKTPWR